MPNTRGPPKIVAHDEESLTRGPMTVEDLSKLRTAFDNCGTVTAGNASTISDGGAALVMASARKAIELGLSILAIVKGQADAAQSAEMFTTAPAKAIPIAIQRAGIRADDVDFMR